MRRPCDLVMKGGVTSGVVYPPAIYAISRAFDLRSIGGTSAGAIAAALAAAAQYRRLSGAPDPEAGFDLLAAIPRWLGADGHLFGLFTPNAATRGLFDSLISLGAPRRSVAQRVAGLLRTYPFAALAGGAPGLAHFLLAGSTTNAATRGLHRFLATLGFLAGAGAGAVVAFAIDAAKGLKRNGFGLVTGIDDANPASLCTWLATTTEQIAGLEAGRTPLTFGMLWNPAGGAVPNALEDVPVETRIDLKMMTTAIVEGRPYLFPTRTDRYRFRPSEMAHFFPPHVVDWMVARARISQHQYRFEGEALVPLPPIGDLPILVATRMSLAFPILLSAVPLYFIEYAADGTGTPVRGLFSDGGLTSNFPVALFDSPLPRWPTLALNIGDFPPGADATTADVVMASDNRPGAIYPSNPVTDIASFGGAIFATMQNWGDTTLARLPGYRDRIVTIRLRADEGGLNLAMDAKTIAALVDRGRRAGEMLVERFAAPSELGRVVDTHAMSWENHRWIRYRTIMSELRDLLARFGAAWYGPASGDEPYDELVRATNPGTVPRRSYSFPNDPQTRESLVALTEALAQLGNELSTQAALGHNEPHPPAQLTTHARLDHS